MNKQQTASRPAWPLPLVVFGVLVAGVVAFHLAPVLVNRITYQAMKRTADLTDSDQDFLYVSMPWRADHEAVWRVTGKKSVVAADGLLAYSNALYGGERGGMVFQFSGGQLDVVVHMFPEANHGMMLRRLSNAYGSPRRVRHDESLTGWGYRWNRRSETVTLVEQSPGLVLVLRAGP